MPVTGAVHVHIFGAGEAVQLGNRLIRAGSGDRLKKRLYEAIARANTGLEADIRRSALTHLPKRNGLAREVSTSRITIRRMFSDHSGIGINITATHEYDIKGMDEQGMVVHPLFGDRRHWYTQFEGVRPGWFSDPTNARIKPTHAAILRAVERYAREIER